MLKPFLLGAVCAAAVSAVPAHASHSSTGAAVVIEWNQILQDTVPAVSIMQPRFFAMMHIAMFDAANAADAAFTPYRVHVRHAGGASAEAAAAQAAHDVLVALIPASQGTYDAALAARLASIPRGRAMLGVAVGKKVAHEILAWRQNDGWAAAQPLYELPPLPGLWQLTPGVMRAAFTHVANIQPLALITPTQYLPPPPPTLTSDHYAEDFDEVKLIGSVTSATRTADQTLVARAWAGGVISRTSLFAVWNNVARDVATRRGLSLVETARLFALLNASIHDGLLTTQTSKFVYGLWRPITAIRRADEDLNPATSPDPAWTPLLSTPPYPAYAGNMACVGASAATVLARVFGTNDIPIRIVWRSLDGMSDAATGNYPGFWEAAQEEERSRVWGGIHFSFDGEVSQVICPKVADFAIANYMKPLR